MVHFSLFQLVVRVHASSQMRAHICWHVLHACGIGFHQSLRTQALNFSGPAPSGAAPAASTIRTLGALLALKQATQKHTDIPSPSFGVPRPLIFPHCVEYCIPHRPSNSHPPPRSHLLLRVCPSIKENELPLVLVIIFLGALSQPLVTRYAPL